MEDFVIAKIEAIFGVLLSFWFFFLASAILFEDPEKTSLALALGGCLVAIYFAIYAFLWVKKAKK